MTAVIRVLDAAIIEEATRTKILNNHDLNRDVLVMAAKLLERTRPLSRIRDHRSTTMDLPPSIYHYRSTTIDLPPSIHHR